MVRAIAAAAVLVAVALAVPQFSSAGSPVADPTVPAARDTEAVVLTGKDFPGWSVPSNATVKLPLTDLVGDPITGDPPAGGGCTSFDAQCEHNHYAAPDLDTQN